MRQDFFLRMFQVFTFPAMFLRSSTNQAFCTGFARVRTYDFISLVQGLDFQLVVHPELSATRIAMRFAQGLAGPGLES